MLNFADKDRKVEFNDCTGGLRRCRRNRITNPWSRSSCVGRHPLHTLTQLRRSYSIGMGIFALALPLYILAMDSMAAPPKAKTPRANIIDPGSGVVNFDEPDEAEAAEKSDK